jgi:Tol biopolymer transport system component
MLRLFVLCFNLLLLGIIAIHPNSRKDNGLIAFIADREGDVGNYAISYIYLADSNGHHLRKLIHNTDGYCILFWSAQNQILVVGSGPRLDAYCIPYGNAPLNTIEEIRLSGKSKPINRIRTDSRVWSKNGSWYFTGNAIFSRNGKKTTSYSIDWDSKWYPALSPSGDKLVFWNYFDGIGFFDISTQKESLFPVRVSWTDYMAWSPDEKWIVYVAASETNAYNIFRLRLEDGYTELVGEIEHIPNQIIENLSYSPDGLYIGYVMNGDLYVVNVNSKRIQKLAESNFSKGYTHLYYSWSPDSQSIIYEGWVEEHRTKLFTVHIPSKEIQQITFGNGSDAKPVWIHSAWQAYHQTAMFIVGIIGLLGMMTLWIRR